MASFKRNMPAPRMSPVSRALRQTTMAPTFVESKPTLPPEIISQILDHLAAPDLIRCARSAKRMQEMVYDDTRWIHKLTQLGVWNDAEARQRAEEALKRKLEAQKARDVERRGPGLHDTTSVNGFNAGTGLRSPQATTLFDAGWEDHKPNGHKQQRSNSFGQYVGAVTNGFETISLAGNEDVPASPVRVQRQDPRQALDVFKRVRSIRGRARHEYGKIYAALAPFYDDLAQARSHTDPMVFRMFRDPEQQAKMLSQLRIFARGDVTQGWLHRHEKLESMISIFENAVLREFEQGYEAKDVDGRMRRYAHVLVSLNGGTAVIDSFIHNNHLLLEREQFGNPSQCFEEAASGTIDLGPASEFFQRLCDALNEETSLIERVFPPTVEVQLQLLDRVSEDIIAEYVTPLFDEAHLRSIEFYLTTVAGVFEQMTQFTQSLRPANGTSDDFAQKAGHILNNCFEPHIDLYLADELDYFRNKCTTEVKTWEKQLSEQEASAETFFMSNVHRQAAKRDFMTSFRKVVMMPVNAVQTIPISSPFSSKTVSAPEVAQLEANGTAEIIEHVSQHPGQEAPTDELAAKTALMNSKLEGISSLFSLEVALNLVHAAKASIERAARFVSLGGQSGEEAKEQCQTIFVELLQILGFRHIKPGFDKAVGHLARYSAREVSEHGQSGVKPLVTFLELVNVGDLIQQMVDVFYLQELVATRLSDRDDFLDAAVKEKKRFEQMLDDRVAAGLNKGIDVLMDEVEYICATTQKPTDYNPASGTDAEKMYLDIGPTSTATRVVNLVSSHTGMLVGSADKNMLDVFNQEVGLRLYTVLCKHLKRQRISTDGAIRVISDMNHYFAYVQTFKNRELLRYFSALRELSQIFLIDGKDAKDLATIIADGERYYGILRTEEVLEYCERRADWFSVKGNVEKAMYGMGCVVM